VKALEAKDFEIKNLRRDFTSQNSAIALHQPNHRTGLVVPSSPLVPSLTRFIPRPLLQLTWVLPMIGIFFGLSCIGYLAYKTAEWTSTISHLRATVSSQTSLLKMVKNAALNGMAGEEIAALITL